MTTTVRQGSPQFPTVSGSVPASTRDDIDVAVRILHLRKDNWVALSLRERIAIVDRLMQDFLALAPRWVAASLLAKGIAADSPFVGEEWGAGVWPVLKYLHQLRRSLADVQVYGRPRIPGPITTRAGGQVVARIFPQTLSDRFFLGVTADLWMEPGVTVADLPQTQAVVYQDKHHAGKVALVLGAGNVASIAPLDVLYKLFVEGQVVVLKANPVNAYLGPLLEEAFRAVVEPGFLRMVYGGELEGAYLCQHPQVEEIHITGSDKTFEAIVFGPGPEGAQRKAEQRPLLTRRITAELGNVSPVIVVPGPWSSADLAYQAEHIASTLTNNAGFNCHATCVIIQHAAWSQRERLLSAMRRVLAHVPLRTAYYPGTQQCYQTFLTAHPEAEQLGSPTQEELPWTLIAGVDPTCVNDICFTTEAFCSLFAETALPAASVPEYIDRAVAFANQHLWGTLNATFIVHPRSLQQPEIAAAVERAFANLRYGTIGINYWAGIGFTLGLTPWGAFPGHDLSNIHSGVGVVHNALMFARPQKVILRGPFRTLLPPPWFVTRGRLAGTLLPELASFEVSPSLWKLPGILWSAIRG